MSIDEIIIKQIENLYFDQAFQELIESTERFNILRVLGVEKKKNPILKFYLTFLIQQIIIPWGKVF